MNEQLALAEEQTHIFNNVFSFSLCCTLYMETKPETFRALQTDRQTDRRREDIFVPIAYHTGRSMIVVVSAK